MNWVSVFTSLVSKLSRKGKHNPTSSLCSSQRITSPQTELLVPLFTLVLSTSSHETYDSSSFILYFGPIIFVQWLHALFAFFLTVFHFRFANFFLTIWNYQVLSISKNSSVKILIFSFLLHSPRFHLSTYSSLWNKSPCGPWPPCCSSTIPRAFGTLCEDLSLTGKVITQSLLWRN